MIVLTNSRGCYSSDWSGCRGCGWLHYIFI